MHNNRNHAISVKIEITKRSFLWLYSVVVHATNNPIAQEIRISMLVIRIIILNDKLGWKNRSIQKRMKNSPLIQKNHLILSIFLIPYKINNIL
jgi:hypothetical protein